MRSDSNQVGGNALPNESALTCNRQLSGGAAERKLALLDIYQANDGSVSYPIYTLLGKWRLSAFLVILHQKRSSRNQYTKACFSCHFYIITCSWLHQQNLWVFLCKKKELCIFTSRLDLLNTDENYNSQSGFPSYFFMSFCTQKNCYFTKRHCNQGHPHSLLKIKYHLVFIKNVIKIPWLYL